MMLPGLPPEAFKGLLLSVGSHRGRRPMSPIEVATALKCAQEAGSSAKEIAVALHLDGTTMISRFVRLLTLPSEVQLATDWGRTGATIAFTAAAEIARLKQGQDQKDTCRAALEHNLTSSEVKSVVQLRNRSGKGVAECLAEILRLRPQIERRHILVGAIASTEIRRALERLTQHERDSLVARALRRRYPSLAGASSRLGVDRFLITGDDAVAAVLMADESGFEAGITATIENEVTGAREK
jgi:hypothetical protein